MKLKTLLIILTALVYSSQLYAQKSKYVAEPAISCILTVDVPEVVVKKIESDPESEIEVSNKCELSKYNFIVFDRFGATLISSENIKEKIIFSELEVGSYIWVVELEYSNGAADSKKGNVKVVVK